MVQNSRHDEVMKAQNEVETLQQKARKLREEAAAAEQDLVLSRKDIVAASRLQETSNMAQSATWTLQLNVGREQGTWMPPEWGKSGTRLAVSIDVKFTQAPLPASVSTNSLVGDAKRTRVVAPLTKTVKFMAGLTGERELKVDSGGWAISKPGEGRPDVLRFWLEFPDEVSKNDVNIPKGRVFFSTGVWTSQTIEQLKKNLEPLAKARKEQEDAWNAEIPEGKQGNPFALRERVILKERLDRARRLEMNVLRQLPEEGRGESVKRGPWEESDGRIVDLFLSCNGGLVIQRPAKLGGLLPFFGSEYHILGTFRAVPSID